MNVEEQAFRTTTGLTAEQCFVGSMLVYDEMGWDLCAESLPALTDLEDPWCVQVYASLLELRERGKPCDAASVFFYMQEKSGDAISMQEIHNLTTHFVSANNLLPAAQRVIRDARIRRLQGAAHAALMQAASPNGEDPEEVLARAMAEYEKIGDLRSLSSGFETVRELAAQSIDRLSDALEGRGNEEVWPTGLQPLDEMLAGGFRPGELIIVAARPSVGKSSFSMQVLLNQMLAGIKTAFVSLEMPKHQLVERILAQMGRMDLGILRQPKPETFPEEYWGTLVDCVERMVAAEKNGGELLIDEGSGINKASLYNRFRLAAKRGVKVMAVDYLQLIDLPGRESRTDELGAISRMMKSAAKEFGMALIALSQLNRDVEKRASPRPIMADLRASGEIEQDADTIMFLSRVNSGEDPKEGPVQVCVDVAKQRQGVCSAFAATFNGRYQHWGVSTEPLPSMSGGGRGGGGGRGA